MLPSQQLVDSGLAAPAPLAFNLSASGNSSLLLDGCTVVTSCSNLDQYRHWVGSLAASGTTDVQVAGFGQGGGPGYGYGGQQEALGGGGGG